MAPEQTFAPKRNPLAAPEAFENELPTYRSVSAPAVASAAFGLFSALSFVSYWWLILSVLAVILGVAGAWRMGSRPGMQTGRSFAHAGIAMGLIFGVASFGYDFYSMYSLKSQARAFAVNFLKTLNNSKKKIPPDTGDVIWWMMPPHLRKGKVPEDAAAEVAQLAKDNMKVRMIEEQIRMMAAYAGKDQPIEILEIEQAFFAERDSYASILLKVGDGHDHSDDPEQLATRKPGEIKHEAIGGRPEHALLVVHGIIDGQTTGWYVDELQYPYTPKNYKLTPKKPVVDDDGHGHAH